MIGPLLLELLAGAALVAYLLLWYGNRRKMEWYTFTVAFIGWFTGMSTVVVLPIDIVSGRYLHCTLANPDTSDADCDKPFVYVSQDALYIYWEVVYWTAFVLCWVVTGLTQGYVCSGGFRFWQKMLLSLKAQAIQLVVVGVVGVAGVIFIVATQNMSFAELQGFVIAIANIYALVLIVCFMGYGLVEVPRDIWFRSVRSRRLRFLEFRAAARRENCVEANDELADALAELASLHAAVSLRDKYRPDVDTILKTAGIDIATVRPGEPISPYDVDDEMLVRIHCRIRERTRDADRCKHQWRHNLKAAFFLTDVDNAMDNSSHLLVSPWRVPDRSQLARFKQTLRWFWYCRVEEWALKVLSVLCGLLSLVILWSEVTLSVPSPILSIFELITHSPASSVTVMTVSFATLVYMGVCVYSSLFKMRLFNLFYLVGNHHSDSNSLIFCAGWICRLSFGMCYNYALLLDAQETGYRRVYGKLDYVPVLGLGFNVYFPIFLSVVCLVVASNILGRVMSFCPRVKMFRFDEDLDEEDFEEGRAIIARARERAEADPGVDLNDISFLPVSGNVQRKPKGSGIDRNTAKELFGSADAASSRKGRSRGAPDLHGSPSLSPSSSSSSGGTFFGRLMAKVPGASSASSSSPPSGISRSRDRALLSQDDSEDTGEGIDMHSLSASARTPGASSSSGHHGHQPASGSRPASSAWRTTDTARGKPARNIFDDV